MSKVPTRGPVCQAAVREAHLRWPAAADFLGGRLLRTSSEDYALAALPSGMRITMANPFEDPDASYRVLVNHEGQHSLWPASQPTPKGWTVVHDTDSRASCLEYIEKNWTDMRPMSLINSQRG
jgi:MbtH protein